MESQKTTIRNYKLFWQKLNEIDGWISFEDFLIFKTLLQWQNDEEIEGDLLEIGVFAGKTAILLGYFLKYEEEIHVCDTFDEAPNESRNHAEVALSYSGGICQQQFENSYLRFHHKIPIVYAFESKYLGTRLKGNESFRFTHIDGSHLYDNVISDARFAISNSGKFDSIIVFDDFREAHTPGVAACVYELFESNQVKPVLFSRRKAYFVKGLKTLDLITLQSLLEKHDIATIFDEVKGKEFLRVIGKEVDAKNRLKVTLQKMIPPLLLDTIKSMRAFIAK